MLELLRTGRRLRGARGVPRAVLGPRRRRRRSLPRLRALGGAPPRRRARARPSRARCRCSPAASGRSASAERVSTVGYELGEWERSWDDDGYAAAIESRACRDRARRRLPGEPRPASRRARSPAIPGRSRSGSRHLHPLQSAAARRPRLGGRLGLARALPRPPRRAGSSPRRSRGRGPPASTSRARRTAPST